MPRREREQGQAGRPVRQRAHAAAANSGLHADGEGSQATIAAVVHAASIYRTAVTALACQPKPSKEYRQSAFAKATADALPDTRAKAGSEVRLRAARYGGQPSHGLPTVAQRSLGERERRLVTLTFGSWNQIVRNDRRRAWYSSDRNAFVCDRTQRNVGAVSHRGIDFTQ